MWDVGANQPPLHLRSSRKWCWLDDPTQWPPGAIFLNVDTWVRVELPTLYEVMDSVFFKLENVKYLVECENQEERVTVQRRQERTLQELRINPCLWLRLEFGPRFPYSWGWKQTTNVREWKLWPSSQSARVNVFAGIERRWVPTSQVHMWGLG